MAPIYIGEQDPAHEGQDPGNSSNPSTAKGTQDGNSSEINSIGLPNSAVPLLIQEGFPTGTIVYLDIETSGAQSQPELDYIMAWCSAVSDVGYVPGIYCLSSAYPSIATVEPSVPFWIANPSNPSPGGTPFPTMDPSGSGVATAIAWQYESAPTYTIAISGGSLQVDLDVVKSSQSVQTDTTPPTVTISSPTSEQTFTALPVAVSGTANDSGSPSTGVSLVQVQVNSTGGTWVAATGTTSWSASVALTSGANTIYVRSQDGAGNYSTVASVNVTYNPPDSTPPTVTISSPTSGQTFTTSPVAVSGTANDPGSPSSGVSLVQVQVNGTGGTWVAATGTTSWSTSVALASGANTIYVRSQDGAGNYSTVASVNVTYTPASKAIISLSGDLAFGAVAVGSAVQNLLTIRNSGTATLNVTSLNCPSGFSGSWSGSISPGSFNYVLLTFQPTLPASYSGAINVTSDAGSGANTISVSGTGTSTDTVHNPPITVGAKVQPGNALVMTWPTNAIGFQLEYATNLGPSAIWTPVGSAVTVVNGQNVLTNPATGHGMFFRLRQ